MVIASLQLAAVSDSLRHTLVWICLYFMTKFCRNSSVELVFGLDLSVCVCVCTSTLLLAEGMVQAWEYCPFWKNRLHFLPIFPSFCRLHHLMEREGRKMKQKISVHERIDINMVCCSLLGFKRVLLGLTYENHFTSILVFMSSELQLLDFLISV